MHFTWWLLRGQFQRERRKEKLSTLQMTLPLCLQRWTLLNLQVRPRFPAFSSAAVEIIMSQFCCVHVGVAIMESKLQMQQKHVFPDEALCCGCHSRLMPQQKAHFPPIISDRRLLLQMSCKRNSIRKNGTYRTEDNRDKQSDRLTSCHICLRRKQEMRPWRKACDTCVPVDPTMGNSLWLNTLDGYAW